MKKTLSLIFTLFVAALPLSAQTETADSLKTQAETVDSLQVPEYDSIYVIGGDTLKAALYAPSLKKFEESADHSVATIKQVYYGAALQPGFNPDTVYVDAVNAYARRDYHQAEKLALKGLETDPTNLGLLVRAYGSRNAVNIGDPTQYQNRCIEIFEAILKSGSGVTPEDPFLVTHKTDAMEFVTRYLQPSSIINTETLADGLFKVTFTYIGNTQPMDIYFGLFPARR